MSKNSKKRLKNTTEENSQKGVTKRWQPTRCLTPFIEKQKKSEELLKKN